MRTLLSWDDGCVALLQSVSALMLMDLCLFVGCCTDLTKTGGAHIGAIAKFHNESSRLTVSSMVTQGILNKLCSSSGQTDLSSNMA